MVISPRFWWFRRSQSNFRKQSTFNLVEEAFFWGRLIRLQLQSFSKKEKGFSSPPGAGDFGN